MSIQNLLVLLNSLYMQYYDDTLDTIHISSKKVLHFKHSKSGQILHVDKASFARPSGHKL